jgi:hypothetical protein
MFKGFIDHAFHQMDDSGKIVCQRWWIAGLVGERHNHLHTHWAPEKVQPNWGGRVCGCKPICWRTHIPSLGERHSSESGSNHQKVEDPISEAHTQTWHSITEVHGRGFEAGWASKNTFWRDAIAKEMKNVMPAFEFIDNDKPLIGYKKIPCHMIFDIKSGLVAEGHMTNVPKESV